MGFIDSASGNSIWRGYDYYEEGKVVKVKKISEYEYEGKVKGSYNNVYDVRINVDHPRKSECNCPHAAGKRIICKHKVALYFKVFPKEAKRLLDLDKQYELAEEENNKRRNEAIKQFIDNLSNEELKEHLFNYMSNDEYFRIEYNHVDVMPTLKLSTVIEAFKMISEDWEHYINVKNNKIISFSFEYMNEEELEEYERLIEHNENDLLHVPEWDEWEEYGIMKEFISSIKDANMQNKLLSQAKRKLCFDHFISELIEHDMLEDWYDFKGKQMTKKAIRFLEDNQIQFINDLNMKL